MEPSYNNYYHYGGSVPKPRWVECADKAGLVLERISTMHTQETEARDSAIREAHAWMTLANLYKDDREDQPTAQGA